MGTSQGNCVTCQHTTLYKNLVRRRKDYILLDKETDSIRKEWTKWCIAAH